jgi:hypothetical protein
MAELLVHRSVPWSVFSHVAACCAPRADVVSSRLSATGQAPKVLVRPNWYFYLPNNCPCQGPWEPEGGEFHDR